MAMSGTKHLHRSSWPLSRFTPLLAVLGAELLLLLVVAYQTELDPSPTSSIMSKLMWRNGTVRPPVLLFLIIAGWGFVVSTCRNAGMNIDLVLGGRLQPPFAMYHAALLLLCIIVGAHMVHFIASTTPGITWRPWLTCNIGLHLVLLGLGLTPMHIFLPEPRFSLVRTLYESAIAPLAPVTFWHVSVADYLTSLAKAFSDLQVTTCVTHAILNEAQPNGYVPTTELYRKHWGGCADTYANAVMLALPFWWRLMQCLKVYSVTREQKNLWNALKYSTAFPLVAAGYLRRHRPSHSHDVLYIFCAIIQSSYCYFWDVQMDWGLLVRDRRTRFGYRMREPLLVTKRKAVYAGVCVFNFFTRFVWALAIFGGISGRGAGMFFFESVEILRRTVWAIFRIEWEVVVKVHAVSHVTLPLTSSVAGSDNGSDRDEAHSDEMVVGQSSLPED